MTEPSLAAWLTQFRSSPQFEDRYRALQAVIRQLPAEQAVTVVRHGLDDDDSVVRAGSARWLATQASQTPRPGDEDIWTSIAARWLTLLEDPDPDVRFESARGLIPLNTGHPSAAATLSELLEDDDAQPMMLAAVLQLFSSIRPDAGIPVPAWTRFLHHEQSAVREAAARSLGCWGTGSLELARELALLLDDEEPFVREEAARSLGTMQISSPEVIAALATAANDDDAFVAEAARQSLQLLRG